MPGWIGFTAADDLLNYLYRGVSPTIPSTFYIRLLVSPSSRSGGGTETNYTGYARYAFTRGTSFFAVSSNGRILNSASIVFPTVNSAGNGDLLWFDIVDTASGAFTKIYNGGPIQPARALVVGRAPTFRASALEVTF